MGERGFKLFTELYTHHAMLIRHNPDSIISGRFSKSRRVETWLYQLDLPLERIPDASN